MFKRKPDAPEQATFCDICGARAEKDFNRCVMHLGVIFTNADAARKTARDAVRGEHEVR